MEPGRAGAKRPRPVAGSADHDNASGVVPVSAPIRVMVWNIENFSKTHPGIAARYGIADRIDLVLTAFFVAKPDIVILLEVGPRTTDDDLQIFRSLYDIHLTDATGGKRLEKYAVLIKSRSVVARRVRKIALAENIVDYPRGQRYPVEVQLATPQGTLSIYGIHAPFKDGDARADVMKAIGRHCRNERSVVCGDFNYNTNAQGQLDDDLGLTHMGPLDGGERASTSLTRRGEGSQPYDQVRASEAAASLVQGVCVISADAPFARRVDKRLAAARLAHRRLKTAHARAREAISPPVHERRLGTALADGPGADGPFLVADRLKTRNGELRDLLLNRHDERITAVVEECSRHLDWICQAAEGVPEVWDPLDRQKNAKRAAELLGQVESLIAEARTILDRYGTQVGSADAQGGDIFREALSDHLPIWFTIALSHGRFGEDVDVEMEEAEAVPDLDEPDVEMEEAEAVPEADEREAQAAPEEPDELVVIHEVWHESEEGAEAGEPRRSKRLRKAPPR